MWALTGTHLCGHANTAISTCARSRSTMNEHGESKSIYLIICWHLHLCWCSCSYLHSHSCLCCHSRTPKCELALILQHSGKTLPSDCFRRNLVISAYDNTDDSEIILHTSELNLCPNYVFGWGWLIFWRNKGVRSKDNCELKVNYEIFSCPKYVISFRSVFFIMCFFTSELWMWMSVQSSIYHRLVENMPRIYIYQHFSQIWDLKHFSK